MFHEWHSLGVPTVLHTIASAVTGGKRAYIYNLIYLELPINVTAN